MGGSAWVQWVLNGRAARAARAVGTGAAELALRMDEGRRGGGGWMTGERMQEVRPSWRVSV